MTPYPVAPDMLVPIDIDVTVRIDTRRTSFSAARETLERAITRAYKHDGTRLGRRDQQNLSTDKSPSEGPDDFDEVTAHLRTENTSPGHTLKQVESSISKFVENEFNHDAIGARIIVSNDDGDSSSFGW